MKRSIFSNFRFALFLGSLLLFSLNFTFHCQAESFEELAQRIISKKGGEARRIADLMILYRHLVMHPFIVSRSEKLVDALIEISAPAAQLTSETSPNTRVASIASWVMVHFPRQFTPPQIYERIARASAKNLMFDFFKPEHLSEDDFLIRSYWVDEVLDRVSESYQERNQLMEIAQRYISRGDDRPTALFFERRLYPGLIKILQPPRLPPSKSVLWAFDTIAALGSADQRLHQLMMDWLFLKTPDQKPLEGGLRFTVFKALNSSRTDNQAFFKKILGAPGEIIENRWKLDWIEKHDPKSRSSLELTQAWLVSQLNYSNTEQAFMVKCLKQLKRLEENFGGFTERTNESLKITLGRPGIQQALVRLDKQGEALWPELPGRGLPSEIQSRLAQPELMLSDIEVLLSQLPTHSARDQERILAAILDRMTSEQETYWHESAEAVSKAMLQYALRALERAPRLPLEIGAINRAQSAVNLILKFERKTGFKLPITPELESRLIAIVESGHDYGSNYDNHDVFEFHALQSRSLKALSLVDQFYRETRGQGLSSQALMRLMPKPGSAYPLDRIQFIIDSGKTNLDYQRAALEQVSKNLSRRPVDKKQVESWIKTLSPALLNDSSLKQQLFKIYKNSVFFANSLRVDAFELAVQSGIVSFPVELSSLSSIEETIRRGIPKETLEAQLIQATESHRLYSDILLPDGATLPRLDPEKLHELLEPVILAELDKAFTEVQRDMVFKSLLLKAVETFHFEGKSFEHAVAKLATPEVYPSLWRWGLDRVGSRQMQELRIQALKVLGGIFNHQSFDAAYLIFDHCLNDRDAVVRNASVKFLERVDTKGALPPSLKREAKLMIGDPPFKGRPTETSPTFYEAFSIKPRQNWRESWGCFFKKWRGK